MTDEDDIKPYQPIWNAQERLALVINNACLAILGYYLVRIPLIFLSYFLPNWKTFDLFSITMALPSVVLPTTRLFKEEVGLEAPRLRLSL